MGKIEPEPGTPAILCWGKGTAVLVLDQAPDGRWRCLNLDGKEPGAVVYRHPHAFENVSDELEGEE
jgi:hypothetical protein